MSVPESAVCALSAPPSKPEVKPRPPVPSKPTPDPPQTEKGIPGKSGKVKNIVNKFNQPEPSPGPAQTQAPSPGTGTVVSNGSNGADKTSPQRQAPEVMPKPRVSKGPQAVPDQTVPDQAPPLPMKRSRLRKSPNVPVYGNTPGARVRSGSAPVIVEGGRSGKQPIVSALIFVTPPLL